MSKCLIVLSIVLFTVGCAHTSKNELAALLAQLDTTTPGDQPDGGFIVCQGSTSGNIPTDTLERIAEYKAERKAGTMSVRTYETNVLIGKRWVCIKHMPIPVD